MSFLGGDLPFQRASDPRIDNIERAVNALQTEFEQHQRAVNREREDVIKRIDELNDMIRPIIQEGALPVCQVEGLRIQNMGVSITKLEHAVFGNGKPGLEKLLLGLQSALTQLERDHLRHEGESDKREKESKEIARERRGYLFAIALLLIGDMISRYWLGR